MKLGSFWLPPTAVLAAFLALQPALSQEMLCDAGPGRVLRFLPPLPRGCQGQKVEASGGLSFNIVRSAEKIAEAAWQREVLTKFGERYQDINFAACVTKLCVKGSISGTRRCTISAFPCASDMTKVDVDQIRKAESLTREDAEKVADRERPEVGPGPGPDVGPGPERREGPPDFGRQGRTRFSDIELNDKELIELQSKLCVTPDGIPGQQTFSALSDFRRRAKLPPGPPTRQDLEALRARPLCG